MYRSVIEGSREGKRRSEMRRASKQPVNNIFNKGETFWTFVSFLAEHRCQIFDTYLQQIESSHWIKIYHDNVGVGTLSSLMVCILLISHLNSSPIEATLSHPKENKSTNYLLSPRFEEDKVVAAEEEASVICSDKYDLASSTSA